MRIRDANKIGQRLCNELSMKSMKTGWVSSAINTNSKIVMILKFYGDAQPDIEIPKTYDGLEIQYQYMGKIFG